MTSAAPAELARLQGVLSAVQQCVALLSSSSSAVGTDEIDALLAQLRRYGITSEAAARDPATLSHVLPQMLTEIAQLRDHISALGMAGRRQFYTLQRDVELLVSTSMPDAQRALLSPSASNAAAAASSQLQQQQQPAYSRRAPPRVLVPSAAREDAGAAHAAVVPVGPVRALSGVPASRGGDLLRRAASARPALGGGGGAGGSGAGGGNVSPLHAGAIARASGAADSPVSLDSEATTIGVPLSSLPSLGVPGSPSRGNLRRVPSVATAAMVGAAPAAARPAARFADADDAPNSFQPGPAAQQAIDQAVEKNARLVRENLELRQELARLYSSRAQVVAEPEGVPRSAAAPAAAPALLRPPVTFDDGTQVGAQAQVSPRAAVTSAPSRAGRAAASSGGAADAGGVRRVASRSSRAGAVSPTGAPVRGPSAARDAARSAFQSVEDRMVEVAPMRLAFGDRLMVSKRDLDEREREGLVLCWCPVDELRRVLEERLDAVEELEAERQGADTELREARRLLVDANGRVDALLERNKELKSMNDELWRRLDAQTSDTSTLDELLRAKSDVELRNIELMDARAAEAQRLAQLAAEVSTTRSEHAAMLRRIEELDTLVRMAQADMQQFAQQDRELMQSVNEMGAAYRRGTTALFDLERLQRRYADVREALHKSEQLLQTRDAELDDARNEVEVLRAKWRALFDENDAMRAELARAVGAQHEFNARFDALKAELDAIAGERADIVQMQSVLDGRVGVLSGTLREWKQGSDELIGQLDSRFREQEEARQISSNQARTSSALDRSTASHGLGGRRPRSSSEGADAALDVARMSLALERADALVSEQVAIKAVCHEMRHQLRVLQHEYAVLSRELRFAERGADAPTAEP